MPKDSREPIVRSFQLHNGITFSIRHTARDVSIQAIEGFLAGALDYFRNEEAENTLKGYEGHWQSQAASGRKVHGTAELFHTGEMDNTIFSHANRGPNRLLSHTARRTL